MKKNNYGITLIALAVTIIIMLILAGVTISALTGNSGITTQAKHSKTKNELAAYKEQIDLFIADKKMENEEQRSYAKVIRPRGKVLIRESIAEPG